MARPRSGAPTDEKTSVATPKQPADDRQPFVPPAFLPEDLKDEMQKLHTKLEDKMLPLTTVEQEIQTLKQERQTLRSNKPDSTEAYLKLMELERQLNEKLDKQLEILKAVKKPKKELDALKTLTKFLNELSEKNSKPSKDDISFYILKFTNSIRTSDSRELLHSTTMNPLGMVLKNPQSDLDTLVKNINDYDPSKQEHTAGPKMKP